MFVLCESVSKVSKFYLFFGCKGTTMQRNVQYLKVSKSAMLSNTYNQGNVRNE
jgi:hypothetical protein